MARAKLRTTRSGSNRSLVLACFAVSCVSLTLAYFVGSRMHRADALAALNPLADEFDAVWASLLALALASGLYGATLRARGHRFGKSMLVVAPALLGGSLKGTLRTADPVDPLDDYVFTLSCRHTFEVADWDHRYDSTVTREKEATLWEGSTTVSRDVAPSTKGIPFEIVIPKDGPMLESRSGVVEWRLEVTASCEKVDFVERFPVVVRQETIDKLPGWPRS